MITNSTILNSNISDVTLTNAFVNDSTQYVDEDMDGYGDSPLGNFPDGCPQFFGLSSEQRFGCPDLDGDGWDDELDVYREDIRFWSDVDKRLSSKAHFLFGHIIKIIQTLNDV